MKDKEILEAMNKKSALNYLKKAQKLLKEINFCSPGITKAVNDIKGVEDKNIVMIEKEIESYREIDINVITNDYRIINRK